VTTGAFRTESAHQRDQLTAMIPALEIIASRALGPGEDARDVVQEVLARAIRAIDERRPIHGSLAAFVRGIATHVIADVRLERRRMPIVEADADSLHAANAEPLQLLIDEQERSATDAAVARLSPDDRDLLRRCFVDGMTTADVARQLGEPASRVRKRKSRALQQLRGLLGPAAKDGHTLVARGTRKT
jgi:RNA polymerase sigma-70 factor (ECF subfamily)